MGTITSAALGGALLLFAGCAFPDLRNYEEGSVPESEVATIDNRHGCPWCIDTIRAIHTTDEKSEVELVYSMERDRERNPIKLRAGQYQIEASYRCYKCKGESFRETVILEGGHTYAIKEDSCYTMCSWITGRPAYSGTIWMEDEISGDVIAGRKW